MILMPLSCRAHAADAIAADANVAPPYVAMIIDDLFSRDASRRHYAIFDARHFT